MPGSVQLVHPGRTGDAANVFPLVQALGAFDNGLFAHTPDEQVSLGIHKNGFAQGVCPEIVVGNAAQAGLNAPKNDGQAGKGPPGKVGIDQARAVGARPCLAARCIGIVVPLFAKSRVVRQQRIKRTGAHSGKQARAAHDEQIVCIFPTGLGHNAGTEAVVDQPAGQ